MTDKQPSEDKSHGGKTFSLSADETQMLIYTKQHLDAIFVGIISNIAGKRLGYQVTNSTQFNLSGDLKTMTISESATPGTEQAPTTAPPQSQDDGIVVA